MRKQTQIKILSILETVWDSIKSAKSEKNRSSSEAVLADCYSCITAIDAALSSELSEKRYSEYKELCDYIKQLLEILNQCIINREPFGEVSQAIKDNIKLFSKEISHESEVKLEIVFMPYNASMWDSLESVWIAAEQDDSCNAYVVPIPYFDRTSSGEFGEFHYEGDKFPEYVPIIHYDAFDLAAVHPDIIYIHSPYDECNHVTSVDPRFYSKELKKNTEMLVYIPYYITDGYNKFEDASTFVYPAVMRNADYIIYQSEALLNLLKESGNYNNNALVLGNPKFDSIINMNNHPYRKIASKKDENKTTFLFSTTLGVMLMQPDPIEWIEKILKPIFDIVLSLPDTKLIWRPHPLTKATILSMRPSLENDYDQMIDMYCKNPNFSIDSEPDNYNSFSVSDAMICDGGSLIFSYAITDKPVISYTGNGNEKKYSTMDISSIFFSDKIIKEYEFPGEVKTRSDYMKKRVKAIELFCNKLINNDKVFFSKPNLLKASVVNSDGTAGIKIHRSIIEHLNKRYQNS